MSSREKLRFGDNRVNRLRLPLKSAWLTAQLDLVAELYGIGRLQLR